MVFPLPVGAPTNTLSSLLYTALNTGGTEAIKLSKENNVKLTHLKNQKAIFSLNDNRIVLRSTGWQFFSFCTLGLNGVEERELVLVESLKGRVPESTNTCSFTACFSTRVFPRHMTGRLCGWGRILMLGPPRRERRGDLCSHSTPTKLLAAPSLLPIHYLAHSCYVKRSEINKLPLPRSFWVIRIITLSGRDHQQEDGQLFKCLHCTFYFNTHYF